MRKFTVVLEICWSGCDYLKSFTIPVRRFSLSDSRILTYAVLDILCENKGADCPYYLDLIQYNSLRTFLSRFSKSYPDVCDNVRITVCDDDDAVYSVASFKF